MKGKLTYENLRDYKVKLYGEMKKPMPTSKTSREGRSINSVVRECLLKLEDPDKVNSSRLLTMVRSRWSQLGLNPAGVTSKRVGHALYVTRRRCGGTLTKEGILAIHDMTAESAKVQVSSSQSAPVFTVLNNPAPDEFVRILNILQVTRKFLQEVGGKENAMKAIQALEELL